MAATAVGGVLRRRHSAEMMLKLVQFDRELRKSFKGNTLVRDSLRRSA